MINLTYLSIFLYFMFANNKPIDHTSNSSSKLRVIVEDIIKDTQAR